MITLQSKLAGNYIPSKRLIYDAIDTGNVFTMVAGVTYDLPIDGLLYEYTSLEGKKLYNTATSISMDSIANAVINAIVTLELSGAKDTEIQLITSIPSPVPQHIETLCCNLMRNNDYREYTFKTFWYNGTNSSALEYGFKHQIKSIGNNVDLRYRSIKEYV